MTSHLSNQEIFDLSIENLIKQGGRCINHNGHLLYKILHLNKSSVIGNFIPINFYDSHLEKYSVHDIMNYLINNKVIHYKHRLLFEELEIIHNRYEFDFKYFSKVAVKFNLKQPDILLNYLIL